MPLLIMEQHPHSSGDDNVASRILEANKMHRRTRTCIRGCQYDDQRASCYVVVHTQARFLREKLASLITFLLALANEKRSQ